MSNPAESQAIRDPDVLALLMVQQYLQEQGFHDALKATEKQDGRTYLDSKLPHGSTLLEMIYNSLENEANQQEEQLQKSQAAHEEEDNLRSAALAPLPTCKSLASIVPHTAAVTALAIHDSSIFSGAGSGNVRHTDANGRVVWDIHVASSGILALAIVPPSNDGACTTIVATSMDGSVCLLKTEVACVLARCIPHRKYVVAAAVTSQRYVVTGSWDASLCVVKLLSDEEAALSSCDFRELEVLMTHSFPSGVADVAMLPDGHTAAIALKGGCRLRLFDTESMQEKVAVNMNDFDWDEHLSFSATSLAVSPDGAFVLVSTDGARMLVLRIRDWSKAKLLYGLHTAVQFHHYAACWLGSGHVAAAAAGGCVFIFRLSDGKVVEKVGAHPGSNVRAMVSSPAGDRLVTGSFDKSIGLYLIPDTS